MEQGKGHTSRSSSSSSSSKGYVEEDTFRSDVRAEWIRAVFGNEFPEREQATTEPLSKSATTTQNDNNWKGIGLAGIKSYVSYTVGLKVPRSSSDALPLIPTETITTIKTTTNLNNNQQENNLNQIRGSSISKMEEIIRDKVHDEKPSSSSSLSPQQQQQQQQHPSLGMTLSRLSLGLYVRAVRPGSQAWCAGVEQNSVLVSINDGELNLLAEPSKSALCRIWQYEGYCCSNGNNTSEKVDTSNHTTTTTNNKNYDDDDDVATTNDSHIGRSSSKKTNLIMQIRDPISMTFIKNGTLYKVLFLSGPSDGVGFGIDWGPCGKFCLVQRVRSDGIAHRSGVKPSSIVAAIYTGSCNSSITRNGTNTIYHLDHSSVATTLKETTFSYSQKQRDCSKVDIAMNTTIWIQLCFPPSEARSGYWERQQRDNSPTGLTNGSVSNRNISNTKGSRSYGGTTSPRLRVAAELDGVQIRIHPFLGVGSIFNSIRPRSRRSIGNRSLSPCNARRQSTPNSKGVLVPPSSKLSILAERVANGERLSIWNNDGLNQCNKNINKSNNKIDETTWSSAGHGRFYRPCPVLTNSLPSSLNKKKQKSTSNHMALRSIMEFWDAEQAFIYIIRHHLAAYNEVETKIHASSDTSVLETLREILKSPQPNGNSSSNTTPALSDVLSSFQLFWMGWLSGKNKNEKQSIEMKNYLLNFLNQNSISPPSPSLAFHFEFLAVALDNDDMKTSLSNSRRQRNKQNCESFGEDTKTGSVILPAIHAVTGSTTKLNHTSMQLNGSEVGKSAGENAAFTPIDKKSTPVKTQLRRRFRIFRKKKRPSNKSRATLCQTANTSLEKNGPNINSSYPKINMKHASFPQESTVRSDCKIASSSSGRQKEYSPSKKSFLQSSLSTNSLSSSMSSLMILRDLSNGTISLKLKDSLFANTLRFLDELEIVCSDIEKSLLQSFSQKFARWALLPWTTDKETTLAKVTNTMRERLERYNGEVSSMPLLDPIDSSSKPLSSIDTKGCYILPSAHFPLLLTFDCVGSGKQQRSSSLNNSHSKKIDMDKETITKTVGDYNVFGEQQIYRTAVELVKLKGSRITESNSKLSPRAFFAHVSVSGSVAESYRSVSIDQECNRHVWEKANMVFNSRSDWGPPLTLSLRITEISIEPNEKEMHAKAPRGHISRQRECGYCYIDLTPYWERSSDEWYCRKNGTKGKVGQVTCNARVVASDAFRDFDEHGELLRISSLDSTEYIEIELQITTEMLKSTDRIKRSLLYKHDDDVRQEMFAIEFIKSCDRILRSCGLDMKMLIFQAIPVSRRRGFIEWIHGSVPCSEICQTFAGSILAKKNDKNKIDMKQDIAIPTIGRNNSNEEDDDNATTMSSVAKAGMTNYESLRRFNVDYESPSRGTNYVLPNNNNPIQDFLRSLAYDSDGPYKIQRTVMDTYIKSCAGYSVCTYILGVGDRHLDNLLLHQSGHFFHCDYSFILGSDPKKYLPMRVTQDMINGMGGWSSDNYCQFLSLACAAFLTIRRPENVRHLLSLIRLLQGCNLPDLEETQSIEAAIQGVRDRLQLDLSDEDAIEFMEKLIKDSVASKMWIAVDAIHSLAKRF